MSTKRAVAVVACVALTMGAVGCSRRTSSGEDAASGSVPAAVGMSAGSTPPGSASPGTTGSLGTSTSAAVTPVSVKPAVTPAGTTTEHTIHTPDGRDRTYQLYVPASLPAGVAVPLLVGLHGGTGWGAQFEGNSGFDGLAEANGFVVAYPDGIHIPLTPKSEVWNAGACCGAAAADRDNVDDVGFVAAVIDEVEAARAIDRTRVYAAGHSNGAMLGIRLACELSDRIVAVGVQAGTREVDACQPTHPVSVLEIHGTADHNVPIDGGQGDNSLSRTDYRAPLESLQSFVAANQCPADPTTTVDPKNADVTTLTWAPCDAATAVQWVKVTGANHAWMGHKPASAVAEKLVGSPYLGLDSSFTIWTFLAAHPRQS